MDHVNLAKGYWKPWVSWKALFKDYSNSVIYHVTPNPQRRTKFKILSYNPVWPIPKNIYNFNLLLSFVCFFLPKQLRGKEFEGHVVPPFSSKSVFPYMKPDQRRSLELDTSAFTMPGFINTPEDVVITSYWISYCIRYPDVGRTLTTQQVSVFPCEKNKHFFKKIPKCQEKIFMYSFTCCCFFLEELVCFLLLDSIDRWLIIFLFFLWFPGNLEADLHPNLFFIYIISVYYLFSHSVLFII